MKPIVTWIVLANARTAFVKYNRGPGKGIEDLAGKRWHAEPATLFSDRAGLGHSIAGPGVAAVDQGDPQFQADLAFADEIAAHLDQAQQNKDFDRLILVAGPYMLGLLRNKLSPQVQSTVMADIDKDLTALPIRELQERLGEVIAV